MAASCPKAVLSAQARTWLCTSAGLCTSAEDGFPPILSAPEIKRTQEILFPPGPALHTFHPRPHSPAPLQLVTSGDCGQHRRRGRRGRLGRIRATRRPCGPEFLGSESAAGHDTCAGRGRSASACRFNLNLSLPAVEPAGATAAGQRPAPASAAPWLGRDRGIVWLGPGRDAACLQPPRRVATGRGDRKGRPWHAQAVLPQLYYYYYYY